MIKELALPNTIASQKSVQQKKLSSLNISKDIQEKDNLPISQRLVKNPAHTFYFEATDDQMRFFGIYKGSLIIVDQTLPIKSGAIIVCQVNEEWLVRKYCIRGTQTLLCLNNNFEACLNITGREINIIGAVSWSCLPHRL